MMGICLIEFWKLVSQFYLPVLGRRDGLNSWAERAKKATAKLPNFRTMARQLRASYPAGQVPFLEQAFDAFLKIPYL